jgi:hypothetical protein
VAVQIQLRRGSASEWSTANPILAEGELGCELDTEKFKIGDGSTVWNSLAYATGPVGPRGEKGDTGLTGLTGPAGPAVGFVPIGGIIMWSGTVASIPTSWALCDGNNGTPDLRDKFVVGAKQDSGGVAKSNIRGSLEQSSTVTGVTLTHNGSIADHTGLSHSGIAVGTHGDLTHSSIAIADHASIAALAGMSVGAHGDLSHASIAIADHPSIAALGGMAVGAHPDLSHAAIAIADHPSISGLAMTIGNHSVATANKASNAATGVVTAATLTHAISGPNMPAVTHNISTNNTTTHTGSVYGTHTVTGPSVAAVSHNISVQAGTHVGSVYGTHTVTGPSLAAQTHNISVQAGTHVGTVYGVHSVTQADAHGTAGTVTHSFTAPSDHTPSIVPAFYALAFIMRTA